MGATGGSGRRPPASKIVRAFSALMSLSTSPTGVTRVSLLTSSRLTGFCQEELDERKPECRPRTIESQVPGIPDRSVLGGGWNEQVEGLGGNVVAPQRTSERPVATDRDKEPPAGTENNRFGKLARLPGLIEDDLVQQRARGRVEDQDLVRVVGIPAEAGDIEPAVRSEGQPFR